MFTALLLLALVAGILTMYFFGLPLWSAYAVMAVALAYAIYALRAAGNPINALRLSWMHYVWTSALLFSLGMLSEGISMPRGIPDIPDEGKSMVVSAIVNEKKSMTWGDAMVADIQSADNNPVDATLIRINSAPSLAVPGDIIVFRAVVKPLQDNPESFAKGYADYQHRRGILYVCRIDDSEDIAVAGREKSLSVYALSARQKIESVIDHTPLSPDVKDFLIAVILGDKSQLSAETREVFADCGVAHILALSGMHVAIIASLLMLLLFPMNYSGHYRLRYAVVIVLLWLYVFLTGMAPSTMRAAIMTSCAFLAVIMQRRRSPMVILGMAAIMILLVTPMALFDVGMQLSFLSVASILSFSERFNTVDHRTHPILYKVNALTLTTLVATFGTWLLSAYYFGKIPLMFIPLNLVAVPLLPFYIFVALIFIIAASFGAVLIPLAFILDWAYKGFTDIAFLISDGGNSVLEISPSVISVTLWIIGLTVFAYAVADIRNRRGASIAALVVFIFAGCSVPLLAQDPADLPDKVIISDLYSCMRVKYRTGGVEACDTFPAGCISTHEIAGIRFVGVDVSESVFAETRSSRIPKADYVLVGGNYRGTLDSVATRFPKAKIVIHPSVYIKKEERMIADGRSKGIEAYSLRKDGVLVCK